MKKKISAAGLVLGAVLGVIAAALVGKWIFWLGLGLAIGLAAGTLRARRPEASLTRERQEVSS